MANDQPKEAITFVLESPVSGETASSPIVDALFHSESIGVEMLKVSVLETFLNLAVADLKFSEFIRQILTALMKAVKSEAGSVFEIDPPNQVLFFRAIVGSASDQLQSVTVPLGKGIVGHVAETRLPLVVENVPENTLHLKSISKTIGFEVQNAVALPLIVRGQVYGVLELINRQGEAHFSAADVELLTYLCQMASKLIEIRMMYQWIKTHEANGTLKDAA